MRPAAGLVALVLALIAASPSGASAECAWQKHSKVVFKKVKRHGKLRRVKRTRQWWACDPVAGTGDPSSPQSRPPRPRRRRRSRNPQPAQGTSG